jgi:hypothetical protein
MLIKRLIKNLPLNKKTALPTYREGILTKRKNTLMDMEPNEEIVL